MLENRTLWIDILKGIAIILVVIGHNGPQISSDFIACFHMPLFFLISGWLFSPKKVKDYAKKTTLRLLIPYFCFLFLVGLPQLIAITTKEGMGGGILLIFRMLYGGCYLQDIYAVFWFITVLWMASNLFNFFLSKGSKAIWLLVLIFIAYLSYFTPKPLPWNIHIVPMATAYIWIGYLLKKRENTIRKLCSSYKVITGLAVLVILTIIFLFRESLTFSMKYAEFGIPVISLIVSVVASICVAIIAVWLSKLQLIAKTMAFIGLASMTIMYLHMPIKYYITLSIVPAEIYIVHIACGLFLSLSAYIMMKKMDFTSKFLLGEKNVN